MRKIRNVWEVLWKSIMIIVGGSLAAVLLLTLVELFPVNQKLAEESLQLLQLEGEYPLANVMHNYGFYYFSLFEPMTLDNATDGTILRTVFAEQEGNPFVRAMSMNDYSRYWHGYKVLLKPIFYFMTYWDFRVLNSLLQIMLVGYIAFMIWNETKRRGYVLAFLSSYALLMPMAIFLSLQYTSVFYLTFGGTLFAIKKKEYLLEKSRYIYFFLILGMLTSFFDLLTYPLAVWGLPLIWWFVTLGEEMSGKNRVQKVILSAISWAMGYSLFWAMKWIVATPILKQNVIKDAISQIFYRVGEVEYYSQHLLEAYGRWEVFYSNWRVYEYGIYSAILVAWILWAMIQCVRKGWKIQGKSGAFLLISASALVWYFVLSNHTTIHHFFTYRIYNVSILAFLIFALENSYANSETAKRSVAQYAKEMVYWGVCGCVGLICAMQAKENIDVVYGATYRDLIVKEEDVVEVSFVPTFSEIRKIGFCVLADTGEGTCLVEVLQEGQEIYKLELPLSEHTEVAYEVQDVLWKLKGGQEYQMQITVHGNDDGMRLLITEPELMPLSEYRKIEKNNTEVGGEPLGSFLYHTRVQSKWRLGYATLMCMAYIGFLGKALLEAVYALRTSRYIMKK